MFLVECIFASSAFKVDMDKTCITDFIDNNHGDCEAKYEGLLKVKHCGWVLSQIESEIPSINTDLLHCRIVKNIFH